MGKEKWNETQIWMFAKRMNPPYKIIYVVSSLW